MRIFHEQIGQIMWIFQINVISEKGGKHMTEKQIITMTIQPFWLVCAAKHAEHSSTLQVMRGWH